MFMQKVQATEVKTQFSHFWTITPVWIHIWWWWWWLNVQSHPSNFKVTRPQKLFFTQIECFWTVSQVWIHWWLGDDAQSLTLNRRGAQLFFKVIHQISRSHRTKIADFDLNWAFPDCYSSYSMQNWKIIGHIGNQLWSNEILQGFHLRSISAHCILQRHPGSIHGVSFCMFFQHLTQLLISQSLHPCCSNEPVFTKTVVARSPVWEPIMRLLLEKMGSR